jgi:hypothetical protein
MKKKAELKKLSGLIYSRFSNNTVFQITQLSHFCFSIKYLSVPKVSFLQAAEFSG